MIKDFLLCLSPNYKTPNNPDKRATGPENYSREQACMIVKAASTVGAL
jgi:hypothetical protein